MIDTPGVLSGRKQSIGREYDFASLGDVGSEPWNMALVGVEMGITRWHPLNYVNVGDHNPHE